MWNFCLMTEWGDFSKKWGDFCNFQRLISFLSLSIELSWTLPTYRKSKHFFLVTFNFNIKLNGLCVNFLAYLCLYFINVSSKYFKKVSERCTILSLTFSFFTFLKYKFVYDNLYRSAIFQLLSVIPQELLARTLHNFKET